MIPHRILVYAVVAIFIPSDGKTHDTFDIPVTFNPLAQNSVKRGVETDIFYQMDPEFYSHVTVIDAALNTEKHITEMIKKTISVVFLTIASSHVSKTLLLKDLRYTQSSKWSYTLKVQSIVDASDGRIPKLSDETFIYIIQESAMKVLEKRYAFTVNDILGKLSLTKMQFYGVDEKQWIDVVGIITGKVIEHRSKKLNLTACYLADMVHKTLEEIQGFTLNEVDMYLYNVTMLFDKLPSYKQTVIKRLYQTFNMTETEFAARSNIEVNLKGVLQLFTKNILKELQVTAKQITESDPSFTSEMLLSCTDKWEPFRRVAISISFDNAAKNMSITNQTLSSLIEISYANISTVDQMLRILATLIQPLNDDKQLLETPILSDVLNLHGERNVNIIKGNAFSAITKFTNFTQRQLSLLYNWKPKDYQFASLFSLSDLKNVCSINVYEYTMFTLATINIGHLHVQCKSFKALREIWEKKSVNAIEREFFPKQQIPHDAPISTVVTLMTNASSAINNQVLNITSEVEELLQKITFNNISAVTTYSNLDLLAKSFQDIIQLVVHLNRNGSFDHIIRVVSHSNIQSITPSSSKVTSTVSLFKVQSLVSSSEIQPTKQSINATTSYLTKIIESPTSSKLAQSLESTSTISLFSVQSLVSSNDIQPTKQSTNATTSYLTKIIESPTSSKLTQSLESASTISLFSVQSLVSSNDIQPTKQSTNATISYFSPLSWSNMSLSDTKTKTAMTNISSTDSTVVPSYGETDISQRVSQANSSTMIYFVIQTTDVISNTYSSILSSTLIPTKSTTTLKTTKLDFLISASLTIKTKVLETSSELPSGNYTSVSEKIVTTPNFYSPNATMPTLTPIKHSSTSIQPSKTRPEISSSITGPVNICKPSSCKANQICILKNSKKITCIDGQQLQGEFKITSQKFGEELIDLSSMRARELSKEIKELINSGFQKVENISSYYIGTEVINFTQGSIVVFCKLTFGNELEMSSNIIKTIEQTFVKLMTNTNKFVIDNKSISVSDFDECSAGNNQNTSKSCYVCQNTRGSYKCTCPEGMTGDGETCQVIPNPTRSDDKDDVPWIIYVVIAIMVLLIIFLIVVIIYCDKKHKKYRPQVLDFHNGVIDMYPRSTSYLAQTPESEADRADGLGMVNRHGPAPSMVTFNPSPEEKKKTDIKKDDKPGMLRSFKWIDPA